MRSFAIAAGFFAVASLASPLIARSDDKEPCDENASPCMTYDQASTVANNFASLISAYSNASAEAYLTVDFTDYSDSVSELINGGCPDGPATLGEATFTDRASFEAGQGSQPNIEFDILNLWHTCDTVIIRWRTPLTPEFVTGIIVLETEYQDSDSEPFLIKTVYSEFNSGAWLVDLGVFTPTCSSSKRSVAELPRIM